MKPSSTSREVRSSAQYFLKIFLLVLLFGAKSRAQGLDLDVRLENHRPRLVWNSQTGGVYHVLSRDSLRAGDWQRIATIVSEGPSGGWVDRDVSTATRFYRLAQGDPGMRAQVSIVHPASAPQLLLQTITNGTYSAAKLLVRSLAPLGQFKLPLPLPDLDPFPDVVIPDVQIYFDDVNQSISVWGETTLLGQPVELVGAAYWGPQGTVPTFSLGIKLSQLTLETLSETFQGSPLAGLDFKNTVIILAQETGELDPLRLPGTAFGFYEGERISLDRGVNLFKELDLSPLPVLKGLQLLGIPETTLVLQGILNGVDPNLFFNGTTNSAPALIHLHGLLATTRPSAQPDWISTTSRRLDISLIGSTPASQAEFRSLEQTSNQSAPLVTLTDTYTISIGEDELEFETVTDLSSLASNATLTVTGTAKTNWVSPLGIGWLTLTNVVIELVYVDGVISDAKLASDFITTNGIGGTANIEVPSEEDPAAEFTLSVTNEFDSAQIAEFLRMHVGLEITTNDLPETLQVKEPKLVVKSDPDRTFSLTGKIAVLSDLETEVLVTVFETNGTPDVIVSMQPAQLKLRHLIPTLTNTFLGELSLPIGGFTSGQQEKAIPSEQLDRPAHNFFERIYGDSQFSVSIKTGIELDAVLPLSAFPASVLDALGLNMNDRVLLQGSVNVTLGLLTANGPITLNQLRLEADLPLRPLPGLPASLQPLTVLSRKLVLTAEGGLVDLRLETSVTATIDGKPVTFALQGSLVNTPQSGNVEVIGAMTSTWPSPFGIDWLTLQHVQLRIAGSSAAREAALTGRLLVGSKAVDAAIELSSAGDQTSAKLRASIDQLSLTDLISWAQERFGVSPFGNQPPGSLLDLRQLTLEIQSDPTPQLTVSANATVLNGLSGKVLFTTVRQDGQNEPVLSIGVDNLSLGGLSSRFAGTTAGDLQFPTTAYTFSRKPLSVPSADLSAEARGFFQKVYGQFDFTFKTEAGVSFGAQLPLSLLPAKAVSILGMNPADKIALEGTIGISFGMLSGSATVDLTHLDLEVNLPNARPVQLPSWMTADPAIQRMLAITYRNQPGAENALAIRVTDTVAATVDDARRTFVLSSMITSAGQLTFEGALVGSWVKPFGVDWLTLEQVNLSFATDGTNAQGSLRSSFPLGSKTVDAGIELASVAGEPSATFRASLDQLSLTELISWAQERFGVSPFGDQPPGGLLDLRQLTLEIQTSPSPQVTVSANATVLNGLSSKVLFTMLPQDGQNEPVLSIGVDNLSLGGLSSRFAGTTAGDLQFPTTAYTFSRKPLSIPSSNLSSGARTFFQKIYGQSDFTFTTTAGVSFGAQLPLSLLPAQAVSILGMNPADKVALEGTIGVSFGMLSGSASVDLTHLDLKVALPNARPARLPSWLTADPSLQRSLTLSYQNLPGPENALAIRITDTLGITVDNLRRTFVLSTSVSSAGELTFNGRMLGSWAQPFGVEWLTLEQVNLGFSTDGTTAQGSLSSSFPLGGKTISLGIEVSSGGAQGSAVTLTGAVDQLSINDVIELVRRQVDRPLFPTAPPADFATLNNVSMTIRLGQTRSFSIGATAQLAGQQAELLWSIESAIGQEPHILLGIQPRNWSLGGTFPSLSNPIVDGLSFPTPTLVFANYQKAKAPEELHEEEKSFYGKVFGAGNFSLKIPSGLGLMGGIPVDSLPADGPFRKLLSNLGMPANNLILEGSLGNSLSLITGGGGGADALKDLSLYVKLPPMRPNGSPAWFRSGELSLRITGAPSIAVVGEMTVEIENDILTFLIESGISFPGPSLQLIGGLRAEGGWTSPLGAEWLTINEVLVLLGIDATGSVQLGFTGDVIVGTKDIHVAALLAVNALGVPTNLILEGSSTEGLSLGDLASFQAQIASATFPGATPIPIDRLPDIALRNVLFKFAPRPAPALGIERGLALSGDFYMELQNGAPLQHVAGVSFKVGEGEISATGHMISGSVGPITWRDPYLDIMLSRQQQHLMVGGYADVEFLEGDLDLALTTDAMNLDLDARILDRWDVRLHGQSEFNLATPNFPVNGNMLSDFLGNVTSEAKERFSAISDQGRTAIANAEKTVNDSLALRNLKDLEIGAKINEFINELDLARNAMEATKAVRDSAYFSMISARKSRDAAWNLYVDTPSWQVALKALYYADYLAKAAVYGTRYAAYQAANTSYLIAKAAYDILPPIEQNPIIVALRAELNELNQRLDAFRQQLSATVQTFGTIIDAVQQGAIAIESASFDTTLRSLIDTRKVTMRVTISMLGVRRTFTPGWDFNLTIRENLKPVIDQILRERGII